jgi:hypothetical protein
VVSGKARVQKNAELKDGPESRKCPELTIFSWWQFSEMFGESPDVSRMMQTFWGLFVRF